MSKQTQEALMMAIESLEKIASFTQSTNLLWWQIEARKPINACKEALNTEQVYKDTVPAPKNSLPTWSECKLIIENDEFGKRVKAGLENQVLDTKRTTPKPTELHRFIYEYDDADSYRSDWFLHRLECVIKEALNIANCDLKQPAQEPVDWMDLHKELGFMKWIGADEGWDKAIEAVRNRLIELSKTTSTHVAIVSETYQSRHTIELNGKGLHQGTKLYTHPHQWQGLTDDEIRIIDFDVSTSKENLSADEYILMFAREIEKHHEIK